MEVKIQSQIIDYFSSFEEFYNTSKACLKDCQNYAVTINKLINRCKDIKEAEIVGTPLEQFKGLQAKLCAAIHQQISEEIQDVRTKLNIIEELFEKLSNKNQIFRESCRNINFEEPTLLVKGTPFQPSLKQLIEFTDDTITFAAQVCSQIETSLNILAIKGLKTDSLVDNFRISKNWQRRITEIIAYTSFCSENQI